MRRIALLAALAAATLLGGCGRSEETDSGPAKLPPEASRRSPVDEPPAQHVRAFDWQRRLGVGAVLANDRWVLSVHDDSLPAGTPVTLVWLDEPQSVTRAHVVGRLGAPWVVANTEVEGRAYRLEPVAPNANGHGYAIGITGEVGAPAIDHGRVLVDLDGDGTRETFRECASQEGLHLTVWSGEPLKAPQDWHRYIYLGMDLDVTCTETDTGGQ